MAGYGKINHASVKELIHLKGLSSNHTPDHVHMSLFSLMLYLPLQKANKLLNLLYDLQCASRSLR